MVTLHEVITFLVSMQISISSLQTHNVNRCGRSRHLARKLSLRRKRSSPNVFEMAATETITSIILIKLIRRSKSGSAGMPRPISYAVFCLKKKKKTLTPDLQSYAHIQIKPTPPNRRLQRQACYLAAPIHTSDAQPALHRAHPLPKTNHPHLD